jgi:hypothetical protein
MQTHNLTDHTWLKSMYSIREQWIPSYFRDLPMCCLMKTTSRCESTNAMFKVNSRSSNTLVQFLACFDIAIGWQRYYQRQAEFESDNTSRPLKTELAIEAHASLIYTSTIFLEVQHEIFRSQNRCILAIDGVVDDIKKYTVLHYGINHRLVNEFKVPLIFRQLYIYI